MSALLEQVKEFVRHPEKIHHRDVLSMLPNTLFIQTGLHTTIGAALTIIDQLSTYSSLQFKTIALIRDIYDRDPKREFLDQILRIENEKITIIKDVYTYPSIPPRLVTEYTYIHGNYVITRRDIELNDYIHPISHTTNSILLIAPTYFTYNVQTATDNAYMSDVEFNCKEVLKESYELYSKLKAEGVDIHLFYHEEFHDTPDALFPNNWFSTHRIDGSSLMVLYPMKAENRRKEKRKDIIDNLSNIYPNKLDLSYFEERAKYLESTGSIVLDRVKKVAYMAISERSHIEVGEEWSKLLNYKLITFHATDSNHKPIYHTNVVISIGTKWIVVCLDVIRDPQEKQMVLNSLSSLEKEIIVISDNQHEKFCANILEIQGKNKKIVALSETAYKAFTEQQINTIESLGTKFVPISIPTIEIIGGGSIRCMIAELF